MTHYKQWDIVLVPFPFTDLSTNKKRPSLVISPNQCNVEQDAVIAFITSNLDVKSRFGDYLIQEWKKANLPKPSLIRMKFATIDQSIIIKKLGALPDKDIELFRSELIHYFSI